MRVRLAIFLLLVGASTTLAQTSPPSSASQAWPPLPTSGFVSGRPATDQDIADGNAVFVLKAYGSYFGQPMDIVIPQYAYMTKRGQNSVPVIVVQAEVGGGIKLFGVRTFGGVKATARDYELRLLGTKPPQ
ncbi:MAG: hypothetical protein WA177_21235 [Xanthobacteraceae bacterium]|jgi:hypothetical protein